MFYKSVVVIFITKITDYAKVVKPKVCLSDVAFTIRGNKKIYILDTLFIAQNVINKFISILAILCECNDMEHPLVEHHRYN